MSLKESLQEKIALEHKMRVGTMLASTVMPKENEISIDFELGGIFEGTEKDISIEAVLNADVALYAPEMPTDSNVIACALEPEALPELEKSCEVLTRIPTADPEFGFPKVQPVRVNT
jgi:hypothetical protein